MKLALIALSFCLWSLGSWAQPSYKIHILAEGETLSELLHKENYKPLYGKGNWVDKVLEANHLDSARAKEIKKGFPVILPSAESSEQDLITIRQAAIVKHGILGNRISQHQKVKIGFQYHINNLETSKTNISSAENYGLFLGYEDNNDRRWSGYVYRPAFEAGIVTHGTNRSQLDKVLSYDPTIKLDSKLSFHAPASTTSFGPVLGWETSSKGHIEKNELQVRRDHLLWAGAFVRKDVDAGSNVLFSLQANLQKSVYARETHGSEALDAFKNELSFEVNLTQNYFLKIFSAFESYQNEGVENATSTGARLTYLIQ